MGQATSSGGQNREAAKSTKNGDNPSTTKTADLKAGTEQKKGGTTTKRVQDVQQFCQDFQNLQFKRLQSEMENDVHEFVLNNLLMCINLFEDFDRAKEDAELIKTEIEDELNAALELPADSNMIRGSKKCHLLSGMSQVLAENYTYKSRNQFTGANQKEAILPLDISITFKNIQLCPNMVELDLAPLNGSCDDPPLHLFMEEVGNTSTVPPGYVRLWARDIGNDSISDEGSSSVNGFGTPEFQDSLEEKIDDCDSYLMKGPRSSLNGGRIIAASIAPSSISELRRQSEPYLGGSISRRSSSGYATLETSSGTASWRGRSNSSSSIAMPRKRPIEATSLHLFPPQQRLTANYNNNDDPILLPSCFVRMPGCSDLFRNHVDSDELSMAVEDYFFNGAMETNNMKADAYCLSPLMFQRNFCSDFHHIGRELELGGISEAVVVGASIQSREESRLTENCSNGGVYYMQHIFTPSLDCKAFCGFPAFKKLMSDQIRKRDNSNYSWWLDLKMVDQITAAGCRAIPLGPFESSNEWELSFTKAESLLLSNFHEMHWRAYTFCGLIFHAFLNRIGPQGIGLVHLRHILYNLCNEVPLSVWGMEVQGIHLKTVLTKLYEHLGKGNLPNFFIPTQNMLKYISRHNLSKFQSQLKIVLDNLLVNCIYSMRNMVPTTNGGGGDEGLTPDFNKLYKMVTVEESDLLTIIYPALGEFSKVLGGDDQPSFQENHIYAKRKSSIWEIDRVRNRTRNSIGACQDQIEEEKLKSQLANYFLQSNRARRSMPNSEQCGSDISASAQPGRRQSSVNIMREPAKHFSTRRKTMVVEFFISHFLQLIAKFVENSAPTKAAGLILHVENLCNILLRATLDEITVQEYLEECRSFRKQIGVNVVTEYCLERMAQYNISLKSDELKLLLVDNNNWSFDTPSKGNEHIFPMATAGIKIGRHRGQLKVEVPNMSRSLNSIS